MKLRKLIAILSAVMMLCAIIPMGVFAAPGDVIIDKNFDDGSAFSNGSNENGYMVFNATTANWANVYLYANAIKNATKYEISFDCKANKATNINVKINNNWAYDTFQWTTDVTTEWKTYSCVITTNELAELTSTALLLFSSNTYAVDGAIYYIDNVKVVEYQEPAEPDEPEINNLLVNPGIETGDTTGWTYSGTSASSDVAHSGNYSLKSGNTITEWHSMAKQTVSVTANTEYTYSLWYYYDGTNADASFHALVNNAGGTTIVTNHVKDITPGTWAQVTVTFNSGDNTTVIVYAKNGTANGGGTYYFDDFVLVANGTTEPEEPDEPETPEDIPANSLVTNGGFETGTASGWTVYNGTAVSTDAKYAGSYGLACKGSGWNGIADTTINTVVGKSYRLTFWYKINVAGFNWKITGPVSGTKYGGYWQNTNLGTWQKIELEFIADDTTAKLNISGLDASSSPDFYVDNVALVEVPSPSNDGFIINGDFEVGKTTGWAVHQSTVVSAAAANGSNYGVNLKGNGGWGGMLNQSFKTTKGLKYILTLDLKVNNYGTNMQVRNVADDANLANRWFDANCNTWTTYTFEFTAISTETYLNFCGGGDGSSTGGEDVYVDNIKIVEIPCGHEYDGIQDADCNICGETREVPLVDIVGGGQTSVSEEVKGLAFRFEIEATGTTVDSNNKYVSGSAAIKPFGNDEYELIAMGAVITNKADSNTEDALNLNTVNGKSIINIEAIYLLESDADSLAFATRIVNIPDSGKNTNIYARPYYVFEKDGEILVVYDDIVTQNYNAAIG